jgi:hypothetical protein
MTVLSGAVQLLADESSLNAGVRESATVLGRLCRKALEKKGAPVGSMQWVQIPERGILYLVGVRGVHPTAFWTPEKFSSEDSVWMNARRTLLGQATVCSGLKARTKGAVETTQEMFREYASRVQLPDGEDCRAIIYRQGGGLRSCTACHAARAGVDSDGRLGAESPWVNKKSSGVDSLSASELEGYDLSNTAANYGWLSSGLLSSRTATSSATDSIALDVANA